MADEHGTLVNVSMVLISVGWMSGRVQSEHLDLQLELLLPETQTEPYSQRLFVAALDEIRV